MWHLSQYFKTLPEFNTNSVEVSFVGFFIAIGVCLFLKSDRKTISFRGYFFLLQQKWLKSYTENDMAIGWNTFVKFILERCMENIIKEFKKQILEWIQYRRFVVMLDIGDAQMCQLIVFLYILFQSCREWKT